MIANVIGFRVSSNKFCVTRAGYLCMMTSSNGSIFGVTGLCVENSPVNFPHKGQWRGALVFSLIWACTNGWVKTRNAGDLRRHSAHYGVTVVETLFVDARSVHWSRFPLWRTNNVSLAWSDHYLSVGCLPSSACQSAHLSTYPRKGWSPSSPLHSPWAGTRI